MCPQTTPPARGARSGSLRRGRRGSYQQTPAAVVGCERASPARRPPDSPGPATAPPAATSPPLSPLRREPRLFIDRERRPPSTPRRLPLIRGQPVAARKQTSFSPPPVEAEGRRGGAFSWRARLPPSADRRRGRAAARRPLARKTPPRLAYPPSPDGAAQALPARSPKEALSYIDDRP